MADPRIVLLVNVMDKNEGGNRSTLGVIWALFGFIFRVDGNESLNFPGYRPRRIFMFRLSQVLNIDR